MQMGSASRAENMQSVEPYEQLISPIAIPSTDDESIPSDQTNSSYEHKNPSVSLWGSPSVEVVEIDHVPSWPRDFVIFVIQVIHTF